MMSFSTLADWIKFCPQCQSFHFSTLHVTPTDDGGAATPYKPAIVHVPLSYEPIMRVLARLCSVKKFSFLSTTHTYTHPFNGRFSRTTQVSRYQKGRTNLDFTEARDSEWQWHQLGRAICKSAPCSRQITTPASHHSVSYRPDALPAAQPTASKH